MKCLICERGKMVKKKREYSYGDIPMGKYDFLVCNKCGESFFTNQSWSLVEAKAKKIGIWGLEKRSKISYSGNSMIIRIPKSVSDFMGLSRGDDILIRPESKKKIIVEVGS